jgi:hypothetical protein
MSLITNKLMIGAIIFLLTAAGAASYFLYNKGFKAKEQEVIIEQQENYIETRRRIDEATSGNRSVSDAVDRLRLRQQKRNER